jgi:prepilin-type N-terminal cleavage/methylation domain-containing protein
MKGLRRESGFTVLEMIFAVVIIAVLVTIYAMMVDSYKERRLSEQSAKVLRQAAQAEEQYFVKQQHYFDAEIAGNGGEVYLTTPTGEKTDVRIPPKITLSLRAVKGKSKFVGHTFYTGSKKLHRYDSESGKITTVSRTQDEAG